MLDPFEVAEIEMWPFWKIDGDVNEILNRAEFTVYCKALQASAFRAVLNENEIPVAEMIELPTSVREPILPAEDRRQREHPDLRLARRARTIANLARVISERKVKSGIRRTFMGTGQTVGATSEEKTRFIQCRW